MDFEQFKSEVNRYVETCKDDSEFSVENYGFCYEVVGAIKIMHFPGAHRRYSAWLVKLVAEGGGLGVSETLEKALVIAEAESRMITKYRGRGEEEFKACDEF